MPALHERVAGHLLEAHVREHFPDLRAHLRRRSVPCEASLPSELGHLNKLNPKTRLQCKKQARLSKAFQK